MKLKGSKEQGVGREEPCYCLDNSYESLPGMEFNGNFHELLGRGQDTCSHLASYVYSFLLDFCDLV